MSAFPGNSPYVYIVRNFTVDGTRYEFFDVSSLSAKYEKLPFSIRVLLESVVRNCDNFQVTDDDVKNILRWEELSKKPGGVEVPFRPARVILQDFTGVPAIVDFAAMRDAVKNLGGNPSSINPICPCDLVIDHSVQVDFAKTPDALQKNEELEFQRNKERFMFLKWGANALSNMTIVPPGSGIVHQVNLEHLARVVFNSGNLLYPDSVVGTDSHTTMINGLGVIGWGVGGIEAEAVMLGQAISMLLPEVIGYKIVGQLDSYVTSTDLVLTITKHLRQLGVVGKFVEFFGPGVAALSIADRATISNMCPEYGATIGFFPVDKESLSYLVQTNRSPEKVKVMEEYLRRVKMLRDYSNPAQDPVFSSVIELDLSTVVSSVSGPKRPHDRVAVSDMKNDFEECLTNKVGFKGYGLSEFKLKASASFMYEGNEYVLRHGSVVIAAITSCTNTSNPSVMLGAGLLAKRAVEAGLTVLPYIKTSLSPGSGVVTYYLRESGVIPYLEKLGFAVVGYGCMTCIGNSGPLPEPVMDAIEKSDLICCGVLSGNRNFEGRIHPSTRANYLASPLLVIAYAIAGRIDIDFETEPLGKSSDGKDVFLKDIWPSRSEIQSVEKKFVIPAMFQEVYSQIGKGSASWQQLEAPQTVLYPWDPRSTYIRKPPFFLGMKKIPPGVRAILCARVLLNLGDSVTTDHISPAGSIARNSPAARYLASRGLTPREFNSYGSRRGNHSVMVRGTFANIRLVNKFMDQPGPKTIYFPTNEVMDVYDASERYRMDEIPLIAIVGKDYGSGSSRDWAAKGPYLLASCGSSDDVQVETVLHALIRQFLLRLKQLNIVDSDVADPSSAHEVGVRGIKAVIAESYERIHRSNLVGMGIVPLQFHSGENAETLNLTGRETYSILIPEDARPGQEIHIQLDDGRTFSVILRFDTDVDITYYRHGGILNYMIRNMV